MDSPLFDAGNREVEAERRFALQNPQMLRVRLGDDVLAVKGAMVAYQGRVRFDHEGAGTVGRLLRKVASGDDVGLMRVSGEGEVFFATDAGFVYLVDLADDGLCVNAHNLLAFESGIGWDISRVHGVGMLSAGLFTTTLRGTGTVAIHAIGQPVVLDCTEQPTNVDVQSCVGWSADLMPQVVTSLNVRSLVRGGSGEAFQYAFHGPGFVIVQPTEWVPPTAHGGSGGGFNLGGLLDG